MDVEPDDSIVAIEDRSVDIEQEDRSVELLDGDPQSTVISTERAQQLNPKGSMIWINDSFAAAFWELGQFQKGLEAGQRLVALEPSYFPGYAWIAMNAINLGRVEEARAAVLKARQVAPGFSLQAMQDYFGVSRPEIDRRRNEVLRAVI